MNNILVNWNKVQVKEQELQQSLAGVQQRLRQATARWRQLRQQRHHLLLSGAIPTSSMPPAQPSATSDAAALPAVSAGAHARAPAHTHRHLRNDPGRQVPVQLPHPQSGIAVGVAERACEARGIGSNERGHTEDRSSQLVFAQMTLQQHARCLQTEAQPQEWSLLPRTRRRYYAFLPCSLFRCQVSCHHSSQAIIRRHTMHVIFIDSSAEEGCEPLALLRRTPTALASQSGFRVRLLLVQMYSSTGS
jgi:hypothetical protein